MNADTSTCLTCGTPITAGVLGGKCPTCLKKVALMEPTLMDDTLPVAAPTPSPPVIGWIQPSVEEVAAMLPKGFYTVERFVGRGGMGAVYQGTQTVLNRPVAIKIMRQDHAMDAEFRLRFLREAQTLARMTHPGIVNVIDCGEAGPNFLFIVMEFVEGTDLAEVLDTRDMDEATALQLIPQICEALQFAHDNGIIHRDIKPSNILLTHDGRVKIADFGLAKLIDAGSLLLTRSDVGMGTPDYAAPEQFTPGATVDFRADIYSLGVLIYRMLTGRLPRGAWKLPSEQGTVNQVWDHIVSRSLQTNPDDRYSSVNQVKADLSTKRPSKASKPGGRQPGFNVHSPASLDDFHKRKTRRRMLMLTVGALLALFGGYMGWEKLKPAIWQVGSASGEATKSGPPPQAVWVDAMPELREKVEREKTGAFEDGWLRVNKPSGYDLAYGRSHRDVAVRVTFTGLVAIYLRARPPTGQDKYFHYLGGVGRFGYAYMCLFDPILLRRVGFEQLQFKLGSEFDMNGEHELMMSAQGDKLTLWLDGRIVITHNDSALTEGRIGLSLYDLKHAPEFAPRIRAVEYCELSHSQTAVPTSGKNAPTADVASSQSTVSRIWQAPQPTVSVGTEWTNLIPHIQPERDAIRGEWLVDDKGLHAKRAQWAFCNVAAQDPGTDYDLRYEVTRGEGAHLAMFFAFRKGSTGGYVPIDYYGGGTEFADLPRWATIEDLKDLDMKHPDTVKAMRKEWLPRGKKCTVLLQVREKEVIVSVNDDEAFRWPANWANLQQKGGAGAAMFSSVSGGPLFGVGIFDCEATFHRIEMRRVGEPPPTAFPVGKWSPVFREVPQPGSVAAYEDGWILDTKKKPYRPVLDTDGAPFRGAAGGLRGRFRSLSDTDPHWAWLYLRERGGTGYILAYVPDQKGGLGRMVLGRTDFVGQSYQTTCLAEAPAQAPIPPGKEYAMEFYAIGSWLIGRLNGQVLSFKLEKDPYATPGCFMIHHTPNYYFRDVELLPLDGLPEAEALKLAGVDEKGQDLRGQASSAPAPASRP